jgi:Lysylphosphatidylglycerol synthase TM region
MLDRETSTAQRRSAPARWSWKTALPYLGTVLIFALIFWRIPVGQVAAALEQASVLKFFGVFLPYSVIYWMIDSACLTWVIRRFNAPLRLREILPIRASMYLLSLINTNLGQGGVAWYLHRKVQVPFLEILSSILFIALMELYQLFLFSTAGVAFYRPVSAGQAELVHVLRIVYAVAWSALAAMIIFFVQARRSRTVRAWLNDTRVGSISRTFVAARPLDYAIVLAIKAPSFLLALLAQHFALTLYGITIPFVKLVLFLPLVFLAAALPIAVAHLGTSQAAWLLFFSANAPGTKILAYSLAAHFTFMLCNGLLGLLFLPRAGRELTTLEPAAHVQPLAQTPSGNRLSHPL